MRLKWYVLTIGGGILNISDKEKLKQTAYAKGFNLSQKFKNYRGWDEVVEPIIIRQLATLFGISNSFIKGLVSDNKPNKELDKSLKELEQSICDKKD